MSQKQIPITALKIGMFVCGLDRSWLHTPFFTHRFLIQDETQIDKLKQSGIQAVDIDIGRGLDIENPADKPAAPEPTPPNNLPVAHEAPLFSIVSEEPQQESESQAPPARPEDAKPPWMMAKAFHAARGFRKELLKRVDTMLHSLAENSTIESQQVREVVQEVIAKAIENQAAFLALVRTRDFDPTLRDHLLSVSTLAAIVGKALHYTPQQLEHLATGAMLHDIGLLRLPHYMYRLPQSLKKGERELYESHPRLGSSLLQRSGGFPESVINIVHEHHETLAEKGRTTSSKQISELSRLVMVIDRYDELLTGQTEQTPIPPQQALSRLYQEAQGGRLDMPSVSHLIRVIGVYPLYSLVALNTGERGIVTALTPGKLHQPVIALFHGADGEAYSPPFLVDLSQQPSGSKTRSIVATLDIDQEGINLEDILSQFEPVTTPAQDT